MTEKERQDKGVKTDAYVCAYLDEHVQQGARTGIQPCKYILGFSVTSSQCFIRSLSCFAHVVGSEILNSVYY
jgi:hypothetical protein